MLPRGSRWVAAKVAAMPAWQVVGDDGDVYASSRAGVVVFVWCMPLSVRWWPTRLCRSLSPFLPQCLPSAPPELLGSQAEFYCRPSWIAIEMPNSVVPGSKSREGGRTFPSPK